jgi:hypothetical protein
MKRAPKDQDLLNILKELEGLKAQYPEDLLAARRASFLEQVAQSAPVQAEEHPALQDREVVSQLRDLGSIPVKYPSRLLAARRAAFTRRIAWLNFVSLSKAVWMAIQNRLRIPALPARSPAMQAVPISLLVAGLTLAVFIGYSFYGNQAVFSPVSKSGSVHSGRILSSDAREVRIVCKPGAQPPLCLAGEYQGTVKLTYQGNGSARPAVAKDTIPGADSIHKAAYLNDGLYGPGASWISNSKNSWIKIDLGKPTKLNTVTFGRDRLGELTGHNPGQFVISMALQDDVYANGNSSNDNTEYEMVFNSKQAGFSGKISGTETVTAQFAPRLARFIKITFENKGTAIDEVEAFLKEPPVASSSPITKTRDKQSVDSSSPPVAGTSAPSFTSTSQPVDTATALPTVTPVPSDTATPIPTATDVPTNTPVPSSTAVPTSTGIPIDTATPAPSDTPLPPPTNTPAPPDPDTLAPTVPATQADTQSKLDYYDYLTSLPVVP